MSNAGLMLLDRDLADHLAVAVRFYREALARRGLARPVGRTVGRALAALGADKLGYLSLHQLLDHEPDRLADHVGVLVAESLPDDLLDRHPVDTGHLWCLVLVEPSASPTMVSAAVAGTTFRPLRSYTTLRDVTPGRKPYTHASLTRVASA